MKKKKLYIILSIVFVFLIVILLFAVNYFNKQSLIRRNETPVIKNEIPQKDLNLERQKDINNYNQAQEAQNLNSCNLIGDEPYKNLCIQEIAINTKASSSCMTISNEDTRSYCSSAIALNKAEENKNMADCLIIEQSMLKKVCVERLAENSKITDCNQLLDVDLKNTCLSIIYYNQAKLEKNAKTCIRIPELIRRANCLSEIQNIDLHTDLDHDGLDFLQEILSNTDPSNPDTDGDGFKDGDEIIGGYNPDGAGSITPVKSSNIVSCSDIKDELIKAICSHEFKSNSFDLFKCSDIKDLKLKQYCEARFSSSSPVKK